MSVELPAGRSPIIVGVPTLSRYDLLDRLITSAEDGTIKPDRYLIVDNGGKFTQTPSVRRAITRGARVSVLSPDKNIGVAASWNAILREARDDHVVVSNDDITLGPETLARLYGDDGVGRHEFVIAEGPPHANGWCLFAQAPGCTERVGFYDENFYPAYYEDSDFHHRMVLAGVEPYRLPTDHTHEGWATIKQEGRDGPIYRGQQRCLDYYVKKWGGAPGHERFAEPFDGHATSPPASPRDDGWTDVTLEENMNRFQRRAMKAMTGKFKRVCLCMIVKNEGQTILRCLTAAAPFVDCWAIADTGSTDDTPAIVERFFAARGAPGKLLRTTFRNFSQARNEALELARTVPNWEYALLIDADMVLSGELDVSALSAVAYNLMQRDGSLNYWNTRLVRRDVPAKYVGVTHEFLSVSGPENLSGLVIDDRCDGGNRGEKAERDIRLLNEDLAQDPKNERSMFYLAQTYREIGRHHEAIQWYRRRIERGGWDEEIWASYYGIARSYLGLGDEPQLTKGCFEAYNFRPSRGEPLKLLAQFYRERGQNESALLLAEELATIPYPGDLLFVERGVYEFGADQELSIAGFYSKLPRRREASYRACARLTTCANGSIRAEAHKNFTFHAKSAHELFGAELSEIAWKPADGYAPMNPSVCVGSDGRRFALVRTVNYTVADGQYPTQDGSGIIRTHNHILEMDADWKTISATEVTNAPSLPARKLGFVEGYEDCRLWHDGSQFYASATVRDSLDSDGRCEMSILTLVEKPHNLDGGQPPEWRVTNVDVVRDYEGHQTQKNWMPVVGKPGRFLYLCDPTIAVDRTDGVTLEVARSAPPSCLADLRGGSQLVPYRDGWLAITHEVVWRPERVYLHRFVQFDAHLQVTAVSDPFFFERLGIEFCAGLAQDGARWIASFGVSDASAHLAVFDETSIERELRSMSVTTK